ncbi:MAG: hypothetical protein PHQ42_04730 [Patescibacteria group bacterium]|nr:hypothetical protein [Patescibacteria group bacterium]
MWNWIKNLFGGNKKQEGEVQADAVSQPVPPMPEEAGEEKNSSGTGEN